LQTTNQGANCLMIVRRYTGSSLEQLQKTILKELGKDAIIISSQKKHRTNIIPGIHKTIYEVTAVLEEAINTNQKQINQQQTQPILDIQKQQYRGIRQSMRLLDEKLADVDQWMEQLNHKLTNNNSPYLINIHHDWKNTINQLAIKLANGKQPQQQHWRKALLKTLPPCSSLDLELKKYNLQLPQIYIMVGSTGVGKTTTLAKLAAKSVLTYQRNIAMITLDTFRMAAVEQLREYATLLGVEFAVAFTSQELKQHINRFKNKEIIFIDTPGRGQFDEAGIEEIKTKLGKSIHFNSLLTVPANIRQSEIEGMIHSYKAIAPPNAIILTKSDEATCCDGITKLLQITGLPIAYITNGQRVPEDIHIATKDSVANLIMPTTNISTDDGVNDK